MLLCEVKPFEQVPPDLAIADQGEQALRGSPDLEQAFRVHGKEERKDELIREAVKSSKVISRKGAHVMLKQI